MLLQREIKVFIRNTLLSTVLKQLPSPTSASLSISLKLDLTKTFRQAYPIGAFIIGDFPKFMKLVEECLMEGMRQAKVVPPTYGANISMVLANCPLQRHNIESVEFLSAAFEQQRGVLVYLKDARITMVSQPELYLSSWEELWVGQCSCSGDRQSIRRGQSLLQIVQAKTQNIREAVVIDPPRCNECMAKFKLIGMQDQYFRNCQRVRVMLTGREAGGKEDLFQRGQVDILLDEPQVQLFSEGTVADLCCYYSCEPRITKITPAGSIFIRAESGLLLVSCYPCSALSSNNNLFFSSLQGISCEYIRCEDPRDEDTVCYNYKNLLKTVNLIRFPYLGENTLSTLKLVAITSLFSLAHKNPLHFLAITDEVTLLRQALQLSGVAIRQWPSLYDHPTLTQFLNSCHNCVLIVTNPSKKDFDYINSILSDQILSGVNLALWVVAEPNPDQKREPSLEKFHIIIDLSSLKNFNICRGVYDSMLDQKLQSFLQETNQILMTVPKGKRKPEVIIDYGGDNFEGVQSDSREMESENKTALQLLERYFVRAREYKTITASSLDNIKRIAEGFAYFRSFLRQPKGESEKPPINVLDAILSIFIEEETSRSKFSSSNTLFSNEISKLMLNQGDCELSFWEYEVDEEHGLGQSKRMIPKDEMFKRMVGKLLDLLYNHQVS